MSAVADGRGAAEEALDTQGPAPGPTGSAARWRAVSRRLDADPDLVAVAGDHGVLWDARRVSLAGRGDAFTIALVPDVRQDPGRAAAAVGKVLGQVAVDDALDLPGTGPVALGAWPFDPAAPADLTVPSVVVGRAEDGTRWATTVLDEGAGPQDHDAALDAVLADAAEQAATAELAGFAADEPRRPGGFEVRSARAPEDWCASVAAARDALAAGAADKVVLAREVTVTADADIPVGSVLRRLRATFPDSLRFCVEGFVGASPELLVARSGDIVRCHPMAGTAPRRGDPAADARLAAALVASEKNRIEHRHTIDLVHESLLTYCSYLDEEAEPSIVAMANVQHLATRLEGRLSAPAASVIELMCVLHPTPAVCGRPRSAALALIAEHEALDRGAYAGPVGWVDRRGNGAWAVGIRGAQIEGPTARVLAGVGVVADSDPGIELAETRAKLQALLGAIVRP